MDNIDEGDCARVVFGGEGGRDAEFSVCHARFMVWPMFVHHVELPTPSVGCVGGTGSLRDSKTCRREDEGTVLGVGATVSRSGEGVAWMFRSLDACCASSSTREEGGPCVDAGNLGPGANEPRWMLT